MYTKETLQEEKNSFLKRIFTGCLKESSALNIDKKYENVKYISNTSIDLALSKYFQTDR